MTQTEKDQFQPLLAIEDMRRLFGGVTRQTISGYVDSGLLPQPMKWGGRNYWDHDEVRDAIKRALDAREKQP